MWPSLKTGFGLFGRGTARGVKDGIKDEAKERAKDAVGRLLQEMEDRHANAIAGPDPNLEAVRVATVAPIQGTPDQAQGVAQTQAAVARADQVQGVAETQTAVARADRYMAIAGFVVVGGVAIWYWRR